MKKIFIIFFILLSFWYNLTKANFNNFFSILPEEQKNYWNIKILEIVFGWDIMLSRTVGYKNKKEGYDKTFKKFYPNENFSEKTLLFYNLESPFSEKDNDVLERTFIFRANKRNMEVINNLRKKKKMILSLANNHILNAWIDWLNLTTYLLDKNNILHIWVSKGEKIPYKKYFHNSVNICFSGYTYDWRDIKTKNENYFINKIEKEKIISDLEKMKKDNCDFKLVSLHWWEEYIFKASKKQKDLAHSIIDAWADLILGHHSHIPGEIELYKWKYIFYSLWNFIFDQNWWTTYKDKNMDAIYDEKLRKNTIPTYIWNTYYHKYLISENNINLVETQNIKHRINNWILEKY